MPAFAGMTIEGISDAFRRSSAIAAGVDFICSGAAFQSGSHRNMERAGMRIQFVRAVWTEL